MEIEPVRYTSSASSAADEDAQDFVTSTTMPIFIAGEGASDIDLGQAPTTWLFLRVIGYVALLGMVCPLIFVLALLPLELDLLPEGPGKLYFCFVLRLPRIAFSSSLFRASMGQGPPLLATAAFAFCVLLVDAAGSFELLPGLVERVWNLAAGALLLFFPSVYTVVGRLVCCGRAGPVCMHMLAMMIGSVPPLSAAICYSLTGTMGWAGRWDLLTLVMLLWTMLPYFLKCAGKKIWRRAAPAIPGLSGVLWVFYCEVAFSCFGFLVFMQSYESTLAYAVSLMYLMCLKLLQGTKLGYRWRPCMGTLTTHRLVLYLDMFAAVVGRVTAYVLYVAFSLLGLILPDQSAEMGGSDPSNPAARLQTISVNILRFQDVSYECLWVAAVGISLIAMTYTTFNFVVACFWKQGAKESGAAPGGAAPGAPPRHAWGASESKPPGMHFDGVCTEMPSGGSLNGCGGSPKMPASAEQCHCDEAGIVEVEVVGCRWLPGALTTGDAMKLQNQLVLRFIATFRGTLLATLVFVFSLSVHVVDVVQEFGQPDA